MIAICQTYAKSISKNIDIGWKLCLTGL